MPDSRPNPELLRSLGRLVRGLSMLFWGLPAALVSCILTAMMGMLHLFNVALPAVTTAWLVIGLWQLGYFQRQERIWIRTLDGAIWLGLVNIGLSPFLFWWNQHPNEPWFTAAVGVMGFNSLLFLSSINLVLQRLTAMLPDEGMREETRQFSGLNRLLLLAILLLGIVLLVSARHPAAMVALLRLIPSMDSTSATILVLNLTSGGVWVWLLVFLSLLPLALTMALLWKIKGIILDSVFGAGM